MMKPKITGYGKINRDSLRLFHSQSLLQMPTAGKKGIQAQGQFSILQAFSSYKNMHSPI